MLQSTETSRSRSSGSVRTNGVVRKLLKVRLYGKAGIQASEVLERVGQSMVRRGLRTISLAAQINHPNQMKNLGALQGRLLEIFLRDMLRIAKSIPTLSEKVSDSSAGSLPDVE